MGGKNKMSVPAMANPQKVEAKLVAYYGRYPQEKDVNLLDELVWFMLSTRTTVLLCDRAFEALRKRYPSYLEMLSASIESLAEPLKCTGFSRRRAESIQKSLEMIKDKFGQITLEPLRKLSVEQAESFLVTLPGVGFKVARCFLQFGLNAPVFAVDTHIWRISQRLGWLPDQHGRPPFRKGMDALQAFVPKDDTVSLHVNLIRLGRDFCSAQSMDCRHCPLHSLCPRKS